MIEECENKIKIYSSTNTTDLKIKILIFILAAIYGTYMYFSAHAYNLFFLILSLFMIIFIYVFLKMIKKKKIQVLEAEITKEGIKFYTKKQVIEYKYKDLKNISYDYYHNSHNEIFVNYYDDNQKLKTAIFFITGCRKKTFVDLVNRTRPNNEESIK